MSEPSVPGGRGVVLDLPCGETKHVRELDLGKRGFDCPYGDSYAIVMDIRPPDHFLPKSLVGILQETIETMSDDMLEFGTAHLISIVLGEFPGAVVSRDVSEGGKPDAGIVWTTDFDSRRLHKIIVELVVELMRRAASHADGDDTILEFEPKILQFDVDEFVDRYHARHDLDPEPYM